MPWIALARLAEKVLRPAWLDQIFAIAQLTARNTDPQKGKTKQFKLAEQGKKNHPLGKQSRPRVVDNWIG